jgi:hypothetical protein
MELEEAPDGNPNGTRSASSADHHRLGGYLDRRGLEGARRAGGPRGLLLGFAKIESTAETILEAAQRAIDLADKVPTEESRANEDFDRLQELADEDGFVSPALWWTEANRGR